MQTENGTEQNSNALTTVKSKGRINRCNAHKGGKEDESDSIFVLTRKREFALIIIVWMIIGTLVYGYAIQMNGEYVGWIKGYYMAVNVGFSIGFGYPAEDAYNQGWALIFSSCYILVGASVAGVALASFANQISADTDNWYTNMKQKKECDIVTRSYTFGKNTTRSINDLPSVSLKQVIVAFHHKFESVIVPVAMWATVITTMIIYSMIAIGWTFPEALYFAISTLSTGGLYALDAELPDGTKTPQWLFLVTGFCGMIGIPLMAYAMGKFASLAISEQDMDELTGEIRKRATKEELRTLNEIGLENGDDEIDLSEFIILCMLRVGTEKELIEDIVKRFHELDVDKSGKLGLDEILENKTATETDPLLA